MKNLKRVYPFRAVTIAVIILLFALPLAADAEGFRNITVVTHDYFFDDTWRLSVEDIFLVRLSSNFTIQAKAARYDTESRYQWVFSTGPVINFTTNLYTDILYGFGIDSESEIEHQGTINLNFETDDTLLQLGVRGATTPENEYWYLIPSMGGKFNLVSWLSLLNKIFLSWDSDEVFSGSYWGEFEWALSRGFTLRTGGTFTFSSNPGFSVIAGANIHIGTSVVLKYYFKYLSNEMNYIDTPERKDGIENSLYFDIRF
ncbi:MAG: hypothetical protein JW874_04075 [Spirochaetales bacterium]|nr:hypothetical protein [Spirochaetales bacterium]